MIIWSYREVYPVANMNLEVDTNQLLLSKLVEESEAAAGTAASAAAVWEWKWTQSQHAGLFIVWYNYHVFTCMAVSVLIFFRQHIVLNFRKMTKYHTFIPVALKNFLHKNIYLQLRQSMH